ncbi:MAG: VWA domain-containing protein [Maricaulaceae bacterium]|jgi:uncharacterized protein with von Willebrand factor type A (vWA) domain
MFHRFFLELRDAKIPVSLREYLTVLEALDEDVIDHKVEDFYLLSRAALIKDERDLDKFDRVFGHVFKGMEELAELIEARALPEEWLKAFGEKILSEEEMAEIEAMGGWDKLMETLAERLKEQHKRHEGGNKMIGTMGTSPFGAYGYNPEGVRIGQDKSRHRKAVKVWDKREFKNLDGERRLDVRNMQIALRRLRRFAREGAAEELDLDETIDQTAKQGYLDVVMRPERRNAVKVLLLLDVGGSMDPHVNLCEQLFSAARLEFKRLDHYYFHNCVYERLWKDNRRRFSETIDTWKVLHSVPHDTKVVIVGDASMSPYEIVVPGGSVEHMNEEAGAVWLKRFVDLYPNLVWLNPLDRSSWDWTHSIEVVEEILGPDKMFPLTLEGVDAAMAELTR